MGQHQELLRHTQYPDMPTTTTSVCIVAQDAPLAAVCLGPQGYGSISDTDRHRGVPRMTPYLERWLSHMDFMMNASGEYINEACEQSQTVRGEPSTQGPLPQRSIRSRREVQHVLLLPPVWVWRCRFDQLPVQPRCSGHWTAHPGCGGDHTRRFPTTLGASYPINI
jgi:hypothetical protein